MNNKQFLYRFLIYSIQAIFFFMIASCPQFLLAILGRKVNLLLALVPSVIVFEKSQHITWFGFFCGFLMDQNLNIFWGFNAIMLTLLCYFVGIMSEHYLKKNFLSLVIVSTVFIGLFFHLQFLFLYILRGYKELDYAYLYHYLPSMLMAWVVSLPIYLLNRILTFRFRKKQLSFLKKEVK